MPSCRMHVTPYSISCGKQVQLMRPQRLGESKHMTKVQYQRPSPWATTFYKVINPLFRFLAVRFRFQSEVEQEALRVLRVTGRKTNKLYEIPIRVATFGGRRYLVSILGDSQWSRNLRAAGTAQLVTGKWVEAINASELYGQEKAAFLTWYCQQPVYAMGVRTSFGVDPKQITSADIDRLVRSYPVFCVESAAEAE